MATSKITNNRNIEDVSSYFTAQNGAVIRSAYRNGVMVQVSIEVPADCASDTILASVDSKVDKHGGNYADIQAFTQRHNVIHGYVVLSDNHQITYNGATYNAKQYAELIYMSN